MVKVSIIILTKNRSALLKRALESVRKQGFSGYEVIVVNDGSTDNTSEVLSNFQFQIPHFQILNHGVSKGITLSRQEALLAAQGEYVAFLDDDDEWIDSHKLEKQVKYLDEHLEYVLVGGGIEVQNLESRIQKFRPETDESIRKWMLIKNCFFTSTVMVRREVALKVGGFMKDEQDFAEDYDLWLRLGRVGKMYNFQEVFTLYTQPAYSKERFKAFLQKQSKLINRYKKNYPNFWLAKLILTIRLLF